MANLVRVRFQNLLVVRIVMKPCSRPPDQIKVGSFQLQSGEIKPKLSPRVICEVVSVYSG